MDNEKKVFDVDKGLLPYDKPIIEVVNVESNGGLLANSGKQDTQPTTLNVHEGAVIDAYKLGITDDNGGTGIIDKSDLGDDFETDGSWY